MARKDFAETTIRRAGPKPSSGGAENLKSMLLVVGILLVVAGSFVTGFWLGKGRHEPGELGRAAKEQLLAQLKDQQQELTTLKAELKKAGEAKKPVASDQVGDLTFYNSLPKQAVTPAPMTRSPRAPHQQFAKEGIAIGPSSGDVLKHELDASSGKSTDTSRDTQASTPSKPVSSQAGFRVQVGSYQKRSDADGLAEKFRRAGFPSRVDETQVADLGTWFRVCVGPYATRAEANAAITAVQQRMHIAGLLLNGK